MRTVVGRSLIALVGLGVAACGLTDAQSFPLTITLEVVPPSAAAGETVNVRAAARGQSLVWIVMEYGDTGVDTFLTVGFEQTVNATHTYDVPGEKVLRATVRDAVLGEEAQIATLQVTDSVGS